MYSQDDAELNLIGSAQKPQTTNPNEMDHLIRGLRLVIVMRYDRPSP